MATDTQLELGLDIKRMLKELDKLQKRFEKELPQAIDKSEDAIEDFEDSVDKSMKGATQSTKQLGKGFQNMGKQLDKMDQKFKSMESSLGSLKRGFRGLTTVVGTFMAGFAAKSFVQFGADYERTIGQLKSIISGSSKDLAGDMMVLRKAIRETGATTHITAQEAAEAAKALSALGMNAEDTAGNLQLMVEASAALSAPIDEVARIVKNQQNIFRISSREIANTLVGAYQSSAANLEKLDVAFRNVAKDAAGAGMSFAQVTGALGYLIDRGESAMLAGTRLRGVIVRLEKPTNIAKEQMERLGVSFDSIKDDDMPTRFKKIATALKQVGSATERSRILSNMFGAETKGVAQTIIEGYMEGTDVIDGMAKKFVEAGDAADAYKKIVDDVQGAMDNLTSAVQDRLLEVWKTLEPIIKRVLNQATDFIRSLTNEDIYNFMETVGVGLIKAGTAFYNIIANAVNAITGFVNSGGFQKVLAVGAKIVKVTFGQTEVSEIRELRDEIIPALEAQIKADEKNLGKLGNGIISAIQDTAQKGLEGIGIGGRDGFNLGMMTDASAYTQLERARERLAELMKTHGQAEKDSTIMPTVGTDTTADLLSTFQKHIAEMRKNNILMKGMNPSDASNKTPGKANVDYGTKSGLDEAAEDGEGEGKGKLKKDKDGDYLIPDSIKSLIPDLQAFKAMHEDVQKQVIESMMALKGETENVLRLDADRLAAQQVIAQAMAIQAEHFSKPALMQAQLAENAEVLQNIFEDTEDVQDRFVQLLEVRRQLESQIAGAKKADTVESLKHAQLLYGQLEGVIAITDAYEKQMVSEAKATLEAKNRTAFMDAQVSLLQTVQDKMDSNLSFAEKYKLLNEASQAVEELALANAEGMTAEMRAQLDSLQKALGLEEKLLGIKVKQTEEEKKQEAEAKKSNSTKAIEAGMRALGMNAPEGEQSGESKAMVAGIAQSGPNASRGMNIVNSATPQEAAIKLVMSNEKVKEGLDKLFGAIFKLVDPLLDMIGPMLGSVTELVEAFKPLTQALKPIGKLVQGAFIKVMKALTTAIKPLVHVLAQVVSIFGAIFGAGGGGSGSFGDGIEDLEAALASVRGALEEMKFGDMNPASAVEKLGEAQQKYDELRKKAFAGDATQEDIEKFVEFSKTYLELSKDVNKSSSKYVKDFNKVNKDLKSMESALEGAIGGGEDEGGFGFDIGAIFEKLLGFIGKLAQALVEAILGLLEGAVSLIAKLAQLVWDKIVEFFTGAVDLFTKLWRFIWGIVETLFTGAIDLFTKLWKFLWGIVEKIFKGTISLYEKLWKLVWGIVEQLFEGGVNLVSQLAKFIWDTLVRWFTGYVNMLSKFYQFIWDIIVKAFEGAKSLLSKLVEFIWGIVEGFFKGAVSLFEQLWKLVWGIVQKMFEGTWNLLEKLANWIWDVVRKFFAGYLSLMSKFYTFIWEKVKEFFEGAVNLLQQLAQFIWSTVNSFFSGAVNLLAQFAQWIWDKVVAFFQGYHNLMTRLVTTVWNKVVEFFKGYHNLLVKFYTFIWEVVQKFFTGAFNLLARLGQFIWGVVQQMFKGGWSLISQAMQLLQSILTKAFSGGYSLFNQIKDRILGFLSGGRNIIQEIINKILKALGINGQKGEIPILPNPFHAIFGSKGGPKHFLSIKYKFGEGGDVPEFGRGGDTISGGMARGPSHQSGMLGMTKDGAPFLFEGGEYIVNKRSSQLLGTDFLARANSVKSGQEKSNFLNSILSKACPDCMKGALPQFATGGSLYSPLFGALNDLPSLPPTTTAPPSQYVAPSGGGFNWLNSASGNINLFSLPNPLKGIAGPKGGWSGKLSYDLAKGSFGVKQNLISLGVGGTPPKDYLQSGPFIDFVDNFWGNSHSATLLDVTNPLRKAANQAKALCMGDGGPIPEFAMGGSLHRTGSNVDLPEYLGGISLPNPVKIIEDGVKGVNNAIKSGVKALNDAVSPALNSFLKGVGVDDLTDFAKGLVDGSIDIVDTMIKQGGDCISDPVKCVKDWFKKASDLCKDAMGALANAAGPEQLRLALKFNSLDFWNAKVNANFGGDVLKLLNTGISAVSSVASGFTGVEKKDWRKNAGFAPNNSPVIPKETTSITPKVSPQKEVGVSHHLDGIFMQFFGMTYAEFMEKIGALKIPGFGNGGLVTGPSHARGGIPAELEGGEFVIRRQAAQMAGYANLAQLNATGQMTNDRSTAILERIAQRLEQQQAPQVTVHVYTDLEGQVQAGISHFKTEIKNRADRIRSSNREFIPMSALV